MTDVFTIGRVCYKTRGRDAGKKVVVVESVKKGFVHVEGRYTKKSKCNVTHLLPTTQKITLPSSYSRMELQKMLEKTGE